MKKLAVLHTVPFLVDMFKTKLSQRFPELKSFHMMDESLIQDLLAAGGVTPGIIRRVAGQAQLAQDAGAELILFTCSSTSPAVDTVRALLEVPIIKIDDPMAAKAVSLGQTIGVVCTSSSTVEASEKLILAHAAKQGKAIEVQVRLESAAFEAVMHGDQARHDELVRAAAAEMAQKSDVVVLAQASMAHLAPDLDSSLDVPVLASPELCLEALAQELMKPASI